MPLHLRTGLLLSLVLASSGAWALSPEQTIAALEASLDPPLRRAGQPAPPGLAARMREAGIPGISIAVLHQGQLHWAKGFGEARAGVPMTASTRLQAASISKAVAAIGAVRLAQAQGVELDDDLRPLLRRWQPQAEPGAPRYTLRRLLSHTAGLGVHGFPGYAADAPLPTVPQILDGLPPANTPAVRPVQSAGLGFRYSGGGSTIVQLWVEDQSGQDYADAMQAWVLGPLGMGSSSYRQPPRAALELHAHAHQGLGKPEPGGWRVYPELQAAGLWTTPSDLVTFLRAVQVARRGGAGPLAPVLARSATTSVAWPAALGFFLEGPQDQPTRFGHNGSNQGFESTAIADLDGSEGLVIMANGNGAWDLMQAVRRTLARLYGWVDDRAVLAAADQRLPAEARRWVGEYTLPDRKPLRLRLRQGALWVDSGPGHWHRLWLTEDGSYASLEGLRGLRFSAQGLQAGISSRWVPRQALTALKVPPLFLRGTMNDWQAQQALKQVGPGRWQLDIELPAGRHEFKVADAQWSAVDLGSTRQEALPAGTWQDLTARAGNLLVDLDRTARYRLELRLPDGPGAAQLRITALR